MDEKGFPLCTSCNTSQTVGSHCVGQSFYIDKYSDASAAWVMTASILIFFMKAGFLFVEDSFVSEPYQRRRVIVSKYLDTCTSAVAFWLFGYSVSLGYQPAVFHEDHDYIFWFFRFTFSSNTATIIGGTLIGERRKMSLIAVFLYTLMISSVIHPFVAWQIWNHDGKLSVYKFCNGSVKCSAGELTLYGVLKEAPSSFFVLDFAGSGTVHLLGGMGGLLLSIFMKIEEKWEYRKINPSVHVHAEEDEAGSDAPLLDTAEVARDATVIPAVDMGEQPQEPKNFWEWMYRDSSEHIEYAALGVLILWTTWFAFNCGSTENISSGKNVQKSFKIYHAITGRIALNMVVCAGSGGLIAIVIGGIAQRKIKATSINTNEISNGILSCLVAITGCCAFVQPWVALLVGVAAVVFYHLGCCVEYCFQLKDTARVVPVHVFSGMVGLLACVGASANKTYIYDVYENMCFCQSLDLSHIDFQFQYILLRQVAGIGFIVAWSLATILPLFLLLSVIRSQILAKLIGIGGFPRDSLIYWLIGDGCLLTSPQNDTT